MTYTLDEIASIIKVKTPNNPTAPVSVLLTDSRSLTYPERTLFFALETRNNDGHRYMRDLYDKGVRSFVGRYVPEDMKDAADADILIVPDVVKALQSIARNHRTRFDVPVIGITGSRGKTTVKEWLYQLLVDDYNIVRSPRSYNSQIGVPLSIWEMDEDTTLGIFEAGISLPDEMTALQSIIRPNIGIITNIGAEHADGFSSLAMKCDEKAILLRDCDCIIYCGDDPVISEAVAEACLTAKEIAWSTVDSDRPLYISTITRHRENTRIDYSYLRADGSITIPFTSDADIQNAIHCLAVMLYLNRPADVTAARMETLSPVGTRIQVMEGVNNCLVVYDAYTSDLNSLSPALDFMARRRTRSRGTTAIISDVMHETLEPSKLYREVAELLYSKGVERVIGIGDEISRHSRYFNADSRFFPSTSAFLAEMSAGDFERELILVKGAAQFHFDLIAEMLEARRHETVLEVNLDSMVHNFNTFRAMLRPTTGIVCMVKASGYGAGSYELAKTLQSQGAAYLAVAVLDEGVELRQAGITMPIMVLNPRVVNYKTMFAYNLEPEIYSFDILREIIAEGEKYGMVDYPVHLKFDTGMHRLGFTEADLPELISLFRHQKAVRARSLFSHLATADCPDLNDYTMMQLTNFDKWCSDLREGFQLQDNASYTQHRRHYQLPGVPVRHGAPRHRAIWHSGAQRWKRVGAPPGVVAPHRHHLHKGVARRHTHRLQLQRHRRPSLAHRHPSGGLCRRHRPSSRQRRHESVDQRPSLPHNRQYMHGCLHDRRYRCRLRGWRPRGDFRRAHPCVRTLRCARHHPLRSPHLSEPARQARLLPRVSHASRRLLMRLRIPLTFVNSGCLTIS